MKKVSRKTPVSKKRGSTKSARGYLKLETSTLCSSGRTTHFHVRNTHKKKRIKASFTICIDVGSPPPGCTPYNRTIRPGKRTTGLCGNRGRITGGKYVD